MLENTNKYQNSLDATLFLDASAMADLQTGTVVSEQGVRCT